MLPITTPCKTLIRTATRNLFAPPILIRSMATEAKQAKHELRQQIKQSLSVLDERTVLDQSRRAQNVILQTPQYQNAKRVAIYLSMPSGEAQTSTLLIDAMRNEKRVYVPYIYKVGAKPRQNVMDMMRIETLAEYGELGRDSWGIPTLSPEGLDERGNAMGGKGLSFSLDGKCVMSEEDVDAGGLDLIIVPGVAFDRQMNRIGHGAGFYDKFLTRFVGDGKRKKPYLMGLCLEEQVVPEGKLVTQEWDWRVDAVAVGDGTLLTLENTP